MFTMPHFSLNHSKTNCLASELQRTQKGMEMESNHTQAELSIGFADSFSQAAVDATQKMRILVADGNATIRKLLRLGLVSEDYEILEATNSEEALATATQRPEPHAILMDAQLSHNLPLLLRPLNPLTT